LIRAYARVLPAFIYRGERSCGKALSEGESGQPARALASSGGDFQWLRGHADAIALLKADHRKVEGLFEQFEAAKGTAKKRALAQQIRTELTVHATIEEEIFYPACKGKVEEDLLNEGYVEHDGAKVLIAEMAPDCLRSLSPDSASSPRLRRPAGNEIGDHPLEDLMPDALSPDLLQKMHAYWRAANYLSAGQIVNRRPSLTPDRRPMLTPLGAG
jgi:hypothetical protein